MKVFFRHHPEHEPDGHITCPPSHVIHAVHRAPTLWSDGLHQFPQPGLLGRRIPATIRSTSQKLRGYSSLPRSLPRPRYVTATPSPGRHLYKYMVLWGDHLSVSWPIMAYHPEDTSARRIDFHLRSTPSANRLFLRFRCPGGPADASRQSKHSSNRVL